MRRQRCLSDLEPDALLRAATPGVTTLSASVIMMTAKRQRNGADDRLDVADFEAAFEIDEDRAGQRRGFVFELFDLLVVGLARRPRGSGAQESGRRY